MPYADPQQQAHAARRSRWRARGITEEHYYEQLEYQGGVCAVCGSPPAEGRLLAVDHCHETDELRGLLCTRCNVGIGALGDTVAGLERALDYLRNGTKRNPKSDE